MDSRRAGIPRGFALEDYEFYLPEDQIAQHPPTRRGTSRLLVVHKNSNPLKLEEKIFTDIVDVLPENCLLVANNSRVVPARLTGRRASGGKVEFLLLSPLPLLEPQPLPPRQTGFREVFSRFRKTGGVLDTPLSGGDAKNLVQSGSAPSMGAKCFVATHAPGEGGPSPSPFFSSSEPSGRGKGNGLTEQSLALGKGGEQERHSPAGHGGYLQERQLENQQENQQGNMSQEEVGWYCAKAEGLLRSSKPVKSGEYLYFSDDLYIEMLERYDFGRSSVRLVWRGDLTALFDKDGMLPLPPYIKRPLTKEGEVSGSVGIWGSDRERYQTVYSNEGKAGSVAAPTAGLHFTPSLQERLVASGREWAEATLYVGYGTFSPVREEDIRNHTMHAEYVELSAKAAEAVNKAKREGRAVVAIGTTSVRILEGVYRSLYNDAADNAPSAGERELREFSGWVNLFLYPGQRFYLTDGLITNFHLPGSSLLMLVSAFAGRERVLAAYTYAVEHGFKFFSYGDSMFIG